MSASAVERIVAATLYEGYVLYPYRPTSVKNQVRWTFGGVHPRAYSEASGGTEAWTARTECLLADDGAAEVDVSLRFLQLMTRTVGRVDEGGDLVDGFEPVHELRVDGVTHRSWEEAVERRVDCGSHPVAALACGERVVPVVIPAWKGTELIRNATGRIVGVIEREHEAVKAHVAVGALSVGAGLVRVHVEVRNTSDLSEAAVRDRGSALRRSLVSTHAVLVASGGRWLSLADPPPHARDAAAACTNLGLWPVLIGEPGAADTVLASPIILDDHPQVAPESPGDLFDATEIDEILSLRILTLTDGEKDEMRAADPRTRAMLERTEALTHEDLMRMHGTIRELRPVRGDLA